MCVGSGRLCGRSKVSDFEDMLEQVVGVHDVQNVVTRLHGGRNFNRHVLHMLLSESVQDTYATVALHVCRLVPNIFQRATRLLRGLVGAVDKLACGPGVDEGESDEGALRT